MLASTLMILCLSTSSITELTSLWRIPGAGRRCYASCGRAHSRRVARRHRVSRPEQLEPLQPSGKSVEFCGRSRFHAPSQGAKPLSRLMFLPVSETPYYTINYTICQGFGLSHNKCDSVSLIILFVSFLVMNQ